MPRFRILPAWHFCSECDTLLDNTECYGSINQKFQRFRDQTFDLSTTSLVCCSETKTVAVEDRMNFSGSSGGWRIPTGIVVVEEVVGLVVANEGYKVVKEVVVVASVEAEAESLPLQNW